MGLGVNIDLAPTFAELAGLPVPDRVDGRSLVPFLRGRPPSSWRSDAYVENYAGPDQTYALRSAPWFYGESEEIAVYDMLADPYQLKNLRRVLPAVESLLTLTCPGWPRWLLPRAFPPR